ncbi:MAG: hypothetical protein ACFE9S_07560 [Candidatus Hermodarchaeota archaeon]
MNNFFCLNFGLYTGEMTLVIEILNWRFYFLLGNKWIHFWLMRRSPHKVLFEWNKRY